MRAGGEELVTLLLADEKLCANKTAKEGLEDMTLLFKYLTIFGVKQRVSLTLPSQTD